MTGLTGDSSGAERDVAGMPPGEPEADSSDAQDAVSYRTVLHNPNIRILSISRACSKAAMATLSYGVMVHLARIGATQIEIAVVSASSYLAAVLFGFQGGTAADSLSKRIAVAGGHGLLAAMCFLIPSLLGTGVGDLMLLMFLASMIMQIVSPGLKAATALVATPSELATASALVSVVGSVASGIGSAFIAPILIKVSGIDLVIYVAGALYLIGAIRALKLPSEERGSTLGSLRAMNWKPQALSLGHTARMIVKYRPVATMILVGGIVAALFESFNTLVPLYVADVLDTDPANSVYIFAPAGIGLLIGTLYAPRLIRKFGERRLAFIALGFMTAGMVLLGLIDFVAPFLAPISPLRILELFGVELNDEVLAASLISIPLNFGSTASGASVMNFINRVVPVANQGATFGFQEVQENILTLVGVLLLGIVADVVGPQLVMVVAPVLIFVVVLWLLRYSFRSVSHMQLSQREAWDVLRSDPTDS